jgi:hypothetical protein
VNRDPDERAQPDGADGAQERDEFEAIVAQWRHEGDVPHWPDEEEPSRVAAEARATEPAPALPQAPDAPGEDDEHFVPPEPPPMPRLGPPAVVGLVMLALGLVLAVAPGWLGISPTYGLPLGLVVLASGLGWLVLRLWPDSPSRRGRDGDDDGAVI